MIAAEAICVLVSLLVEIVTYQYSVRYATPPGRVYPQPPSLQLLSDKMMISASSLIVMFDNTWEEEAPETPSEDAYDRDAPNLCFKSAYL